MSDWIEYAPAGGWTAFARYDALTDALWERLSADDWHYLNVVAGSSVWESRRDGSMVSAQYEGERFVHLAAQGGAAGVLISPLVKGFGLIAGAASDAELDAAPDRRV